MRIRVIKEEGHEEALFGCGLSYGLTSEDYSYDEVNIRTIERLNKTASKLAHMDGGHNKFLESIIVWIDMTASRDFWQQFDTYRSGVTKQSESTMHTLHKIKKFEQEHFEGMDSFFGKTVIFLLNVAKRFITPMALKKMLPEGFLQRRIVCTNYKTLRNIVHQRQNHKLPEWKIFCSEMKQQLIYSTFIFKEGSKD